MVKQWQNPVHVVVECPLTLCTENYPDVRFFGRIEDTIICFRDCLTFKVEKLRDSDLVHYFEDVTKLKILSEITHLLKLVICKLQRDSHLDLDVL